jgi:hypothetical protein
MSGCKIGKTVKLPHYLICIMVRTKTKPTRIPSARLFTVDELQRQKQELIIKDLRQENADLKTRLVLVKENILYGIAELKVKIDDILYELHSEITPLLENIDTDDE